jgi:hypothetical protein
LALTRHDLIPPARRADSLEPLGAQTLQIGTQAQFRFLRRVVGAVLVMNLLDGVLTLVWIALGTASEANPLLAQLAHQQPVLFMGVKTALVALGSLLLWRHRKRRAAVVAIFVCFLAYYFLLLYHLQAMELRLFARWLG